MKFGPRKPSLKRSISAMTTGRAKRTVKRAINPYYGKKGMGWINNPKKALYNKIYHKTTFSVIPTIGDIKKASKTKPTTIAAETSSSKLNKTVEASSSKKWGCWQVVLLLFLWPLILLVWIPYAIYQYACVDEDTVNN